MCGCLLVDSCWTGPFEEEKELRLHSSVVTASLHHLSSLLNLYFLFILNPSELPETWSVTPADHTSVVYAAAAALDYT